MGDCHNSIEIQNIQSAYPLLLLILAYGWLIKHSVGHCAYSVYTSPSVRNRSTEYDYLGLSSPTKKDFQAIVRTNSWFPDWLAVDP